MIALVFFARHRWDRNAVLLRAENQGIQRKNEFANVFALTQVNVRISRFTAAMSRQMGSDWSQLLEVSSTLFALRWRPQRSCAIERIIADILLIRSRWIRANLVNRSYLRHRYTRT